MEKPQSVGLAIRLLWVSLGVDIVPVIFNGSPKLAAKGPAFIVTVIVFTTLIMAFMFRQIAAGKNWARIAYAVFYGLTLPLSIGMLFNAQISRPPLTLIVMSIQIPLQGYALYLLFTKPGSDWYTKASQTPMHTDN
ncbi:MAG: hypothetical protein P4L53_17580 [Candidatus Obscuribacterales bacterium]|nr:hypothetical protein [Candidatus Obscuribacterales bacterium]